MKKVIIYFLVIYAISFFDVRGSDHTQEESGQLKRTKRVFNLQALMCCKSQDGVEKKELKRSPKSNNTFRLILTQLLPNDQCIDNDDMALELKFIKMKDGYVAF